MKRFREQPGAAAEKGEKASASYTYGFRFLLPRSARAVHGSNSKAWDRAGRFSPARFEALLSKYDKDGKGGLSLWEVLAMVRGQSNLGDIMGT